MKKGLKPRTYHLHLQILLNSDQLSSEPFANCIRPRIDHFKAHDSRCNFVRLQPASIAVTCNFPSNGNQSSRWSIEKKVPQNGHKTWVFFHTDSKKTQTIFSTFCAMHICAKLHILVFSQSFPMCLFTNALVWVCNLSTTLLVLF